MIFLHSELEKLQALVKMTLLPTPACLFLVGVRKNEAFFATTSAAAQHHEFILTTLHHLLRLNFLMKTLSSRVARLRVDGGAVSTRATLGWGISRGFIIFLSVLDLQLSNHHFVSTCWMNFWNDDASSFHLYQHHCTFNY